MIDVISIKKRDNKETKECLKGINIYRLGGIKCIYQGWAGQ